MGIHDCFEIQNVSPRQNKKVWRSGGVPSASARLFRASLARDKIKVRTYLPYFK